jgi:hypothetical protein
MSPDVELVCMRLADMTRVHPRQIERPCSRCGETCAVYPSGQNTLREYPEAKVVCQRCAEADPVADNVRARDFRPVKLAGAPGQVEQEARESENKK